VYSPDDLAPIRNPALFEACDQAKQQGKIRFTGVSEHSGPQIPPVLQEVANTGKFDVPACKYNYVEAPGLERAIEALGKSNIRIYVFKASAGNRQGELKEFTDKGASLQQAAVKWALKNPNVASVCCGMLSFDDVKKWTQAASQPFTPEDERLLRRYASLVQATYCRYCGNCAALCPQRVAVADIMRYAMYFRYYGLEKDAMRQYAALPRSAQAAGCAACEGPCTSGCPHGLPTRQNLIEAHRVLA
jgi:predicted aldo/keto reductase-like oxidoreductase